MRRTLSLLCALALLAALTLTAAPAASAKRCSPAGKEIRSGVIDLKTKRLGCRGAKRVMNSWLSKDSCNFGLTCRARGFRCSAPPQDRATPEHPYLKVSCRRGKRRARRVSFRVIA